MTTTRILDHPLQTILAIPLLYDRQKLARIGSHR
jgi:hypothetical protein